MDLNPAPIGRRRASVLEMIAAITVGVVFAHAAVPAFKWAWGGLKAAGRGIRNLFSPRRKRWYGGY
jgi:hypothetical protein